jgi:hypothetical protein
MDKVVHDNVDNDVEDGEFLKAFLLGLNNNERKDFNTHLSLSNTHFNNESSTYKLKI